MSKKYSKEFTTLIQKFNELGSLDYISREYLSLMRQKCFNCNRNRVECAFQPHCENRKYMNIMVQMKSDLNDIPAFCYSQQIRNITDYLSGKAYLIEPVDYKIYLSDFIKILKLKPKSEQKKRDIFVKEIFEKISALKGKVFEPKKKQSIGNYLIFLISGVIYYIDFKKEVVTINLKNKVLETEEQINDLIDLYSQYYNVEIEIVSIS